MSDLAKWKLSGPVRTLRREHAEWDPSQDTWQAFRNVSIVTFRHDGQVSDGECHHPDGSVARWARLYDDGGRVIEAQSWMDDRPRTTQFYSYDAQGRLTAVEDVAPDGGRREADSYKCVPGGHKTKPSFLAARQTDIPIVYYALGAATLSVAYDDRELHRGTSLRPATIAVLV